MVSWTDTLLEKDSTLTNERFIQCPGKWGPDPWKDISILQKNKV